MRRREPEAPRTAGRLQQHVAPGDPEALTEARHMIRAAVRAWGAEDQTDSVELVADELITNALMHTEGSAIVTLRVLGGTGRRLRVEVEDSSSALPRRREAGESGVSGRGLMLVEMLADVWGGGGPRRREVRLVGVRGARARALTARPAGGTGTRWHPGRMPELPEVEALREFLTEHLAGQEIVRVLPVAVSVLKTYDPPIAALEGRQVAAVHRHGKFLDVETAGDRGW